MPTGVGRYDACRECGDFQVTTDDLHCPNCGIVAPSRWLSVAEAQAMVRSRHPEAWREAVGSKAVTVWRLAAIAAIGLVYTTGAVVSLTIALPFAAILYPLARGWATGEAWPDLQTIRSEGSLKATEQMVAERLADMDLRDCSIDRTRAVVKREGASGQWEKIADLLDNAEQALAKQREGCRAQLLDIRIVRWLNRLEPLAYDLGYCGVNQLAERVRQCVALQALGAELVAEALETFGPEHPALLRARRGLESAEVLRQHLVAQQALAAVRGATGIGEQPEADLPTTQGPDLFAARVEALAELASATLEIEAAHARLMAETEVAQQLHSA